jgi:D-alanyl-lipoteichoic acid acyltransferase DltB (MBOAT superfamily)
MENFKRPYFSTSIKEFWSRWHISLSTWFRDYVYIPLGGSKKGSVRTYVNVLLVFLISGLWHGASWMFVIWGAIHGLYQLYEKATYNIRAQLWKYSGLDGTWIQWGVKWFVTMGVVLLSWVFFRAQNLEDALLIINHIGTIRMISFNSLIAAITSTYIDLIRFIIVILSIFIFEYKDYIDSINKQKELLLIKISKSYEFNLLLVVLILIFGAFGRQEFIYFQF